MVGKSRKKGSTSSPNSNHGDENEQVPDGGLKPLVSKEDDGLWFTDEEIVTLMTNSIEENYTVYFTNWTNTPNIVKGQMWNTFKRSIRFSNEDEVKRGYEKFIKKRITDIIYRIKTAKEKPGWMPLDCFLKLQKRKDDPEFKKVSIKATINRKSGGKDGKAPPTHVLGRMNAVKALDNLADGITDATPILLLEKSKKNKEGKWICPRAEAVYNDYNDRMAQPDTNEFEAYLEAVKGYDSKGRVFGVGRAAPQFFVPPKIRSKAGDDMAFTPGLVAKYAMENKELKAQLSHLSKSQQWLIEQVKEKLGWNPPTQDCNSGPNPQPRQDEGPDGGAPERTAEFVDPPV